MDDIILNKVATIERCMKRIAEESRKDWQRNFTYQDALILNVERACQATIDLGMHIVRKDKLGLPKFSREVFDILVLNDILPEETGERLKRMVGFRNLAVHDYGNLNLEIVASIVEKELSVFDEFKVKILKHAGEN